LLTKEKIEQYYLLENQVSVQTDSAFSEEFWIWLNSFGIKKYPELKKLLAPLPNEELRVIVSGIADENEFAQSGSNIYRALTEIIRKNGSSWNQYKRILDFACGCGRVLRLLSKHSATCDIYGCDVNEKHIKWLSKEFSFGTYIKNFSLPPLQFDSGYFNLIYSISLFSHLNEEYQLLWLRELARISAKGSLLILTVHGKHAYSVLQERPDIRERIGLSVNQLDEARLKISSGNFAFIRQEDSYIDRDTYGFTFIPKIYVEKVWTKYFKLIDIEERAIDDWQDAVVLQPRDN